jgi:uncharacterized Zn-binding protein involved in type VI secretion
VPPAARVTDPTPHPGVVTPPGVPTVLIGGMPAASVATALHTCMFPPPVVHPPTPFVPGCPTVLIGGSPALRMGDVSGCGAPIVMGCPTVLIGG